MRVLKLIINPFAEMDTQLAQEWYNLQKDKLGDEFLEELEITISNIASNPFQYAKVQLDIHKAVMRRFPFNVYYTIQNELIIVFAIFHNSRNPLVWKHRVKK